MRPANRCLLLLLLAGSLIGVVVFGEEEPILEVGLARVELPVPGGLSMWGYTPRTNTDTLDPLYARVFFFKVGRDSVALVTLDLGRTFGLPQMERVRSRVRREGDVGDVIFTASHTHSGPYLLDEYPDGEPPAWELEATDAIAEAILEAVRSTFPARLGSARGRADLCHNRRYLRPDGTVKMLWANPTRISTYPVDPEVTVLRIDDRAGNPKAVLVGYACHPVVFGPDNPLYSADFPGAMARHVVERLPGTPLVGFLQGGCGDINPYLDKRSLAADAVRLKDRVGEALGREVVRTIAKAPTGVPVEPSLKLVTETLRFGDRRPGEEATYDAILTVLILNDRYGFVGIPGEPFVEFQLDLKRRADLDAVFLMGYTNGYLRYFPTIRAAVEGGYGAEGRVALVEVGAGERLMVRAYNLLFRMLGRLRAKPLSLRQDGS